MKNKRVILIFYVDALRPDYVDEDKMPFLSSLTKSAHTCHIIPNFGFEPDRAIFFGLNPEDYNGGMHFKYTHKPEFNYYILKFLDIGIFGEVLRKIVRFHIKIRSNTPRIKINPSIAYIPFDFLKYFDFVEKGMPLEYYSINGKESIISILSSKYNFTYLGFPYSKVDLDKTKIYGKNLKTGKFNAVFIFLHQIDGVAHRFGPESRKVYNILLRVDLFIRELFKEFSDSEVDLIVFGDHGMAPVVGTFNFFHALEKLPVIPHKDYIYFIDSVFARFWFFNERARREILNFLNGIDCGKIISNLEKNRYKIRYKDNRFGDVIFWASNGIEFFPSFWNRNAPLKGMHGYRENCKENHTIFVHYNNYGKYKNKIEKDIHSKDIYRLLLEIV